MASFLPALTPARQEFIAAQKIYFVASAPLEGRVNLSPKGLETFRVLAPNRVGYLGVPLFDYKAQRALLTDYFAKKRPRGRRGLLGRQKHAQHRWIADGTSR